MNGVLFIGDLLINTSAPGRRIDDDFLSAVITKLTFALNLCKEKELVPIIVGQAFYKSFDVKVLTEIIPVLKESGAYFLPSMVDSKGSIESVLPKSNLGILLATDTVNIIDNENPLSLIIKNQKCNFHSSNTGNKFQASLEDSKINVLLLRQPNIESEDQINEMSDFQNIDMIINAGTRLEGNEILSNNKTWKNIGPSVRTHLESEEYSPKVFEWNPTTGFKEYILPHNVHVMNHNAITQNIEEQNLVKSDFALMMKEEMIRLEQENDSDLIETELTEILISMDSSIEIKDQISALQKEVEMID